MQSKEDVQKALESQGYSAVEFANDGEANEKGHYRIMATKDGNRSKFSVDANTGQVLPDATDDNRTETSAEAGNQAYRQ